MTSQKQYAQTILDQEAEAIVALARNLDSTFDNAVRSIMSISGHGRLITSGIGKTSFIAMKISASFASVGIPSFFLHPAEAMHGDIGRLTAHDVVILFSNSGDTAEIVRIVPHLNRIGCTIIACTAAAQSYLAQHATIVIALPRHPEAGVHGLAPTTSTTCMLALGDALLMSIVKEKNFTREQFAQRHPGGTLGRTLMQVSEIMRTGDALCIAPEQAICREVLHRITLTKGRPGAAAIVNDQGVLVGIFTDGDLRRLLDEGTQFLEFPVLRVMSKNPKTVAPDVLAEGALKIMSEFQIDQVLVTDTGNRPVGLLDIQDLVRIT